MNALRALRFTPPRSTSTPPKAPALGDAEVAAVPFRCRIFPIGPLHRWSPWQRHEQIEDKRRGQRIIERKTVVYRRRVCLGCRMEQERVE